MRLQTFAKLAGSLAICLAMAATASAQYGGAPGGGMGGSGGTGGTGSGATGSGTPNYSYGPSTGAKVGIGVGAAAGAAVGIALWVHHHHKVKSEALLIGCAQPASNGVSLRSEEDGESYTLISGNNEIKPGERLELKGVVKNDSSGAHAFRVRDVVSDFGACSATVASTHRAEANELAVATK